MTSPARRNLWLLLAGALAVRLVLMPLPEPFPADLSTFWRPWMALGAEQGLVALYRSAEPPVNYPPFYMALLAGLGKVYHLLVPSMAETAWQRMLIKLPAVLADLVITALLYAATLRLAVAGQRAALPASRASRHVGFIEPARVPVLVGGLWAFNPAVIYVTAYWGQVDSIHTMWMLAALVAALAGSWAWSGLLMGLALLTKLHALVLLPLLVLLAWRAGWSKVVRLGVGLGGTVALGLLPLALGGVLGGVWDVYTGAVGFYPRLSLNAFNLWWPLQYVGERIMNWSLSDDMRLLGPVTPRWIGLAALSAYALLILGTLHRARPQPDRRQGSRSQDDSDGTESTGPPVAWDWSPVFLAAGLMVFGFFMLPTEMHERYLLPALAFLALPAGRDRRMLVAYLVLSLTVLANLMEVLPFAPWFYRLLSAVPGERPLIALVNLALFAWITAHFVQTARASRPDQG